MSDQLSLGGIDPPVFTDSLFFALLPDAGTAKRIADLTHHLRADAGLKGVPISSERLHVTLVFLGAFAGLPRSIVSSAIAVGDKFEAASFGLVFDRIQKFGHDRRALVLRGGEDIGAVAEFQHHLIRSMRYEGLKPVGPAGFTPHLTLLYDDNVTAEAMVEPIHWTAREFVLVRSLIGQSRYEVLGRWPLK